MAAYSLYCFAQSGNAFKVASFLAATHADWQVRFVDFMNGEARTAAYRENVNVMGEVPVLEHEGERLTQSGIILDYLAEQTGQFQARDSKDQREVWRWVLFDNHKFTSYTATYRFMKHFMKDASPDVLAFLHGRAKAAWAVLNTQLEKTQAYVIGDYPTVADFSLAGYVYFDDEIGVNWAQDYPAIAAWIDRMKAMPNWQHPYVMMPGHPIPKPA
jgi:glutathione S-transferase